MIDSWDQIKQDKQFKFQREAIFSSRDLVPFEKLL